jgi:O-antigen biosynthesis protein WbqP
MKRFFDTVLSFCALILLSPFMIVIMCLVKVDSPGPVFFYQRRIGLRDKEFLMYKFRTMCVGTPNVATDKLNNPGQYITKIGYFLRKYSLDELPQLVNILLGDMAIVGPRPALYNQYELRAMRQVVGVSTIRPGLTGWAQINGRDDILLEQKVALDLEYLQRYSWWLDVTIIFRTAFSVYAGDGVAKTRRANEVKKFGA